MINLDDFAATVLEIYSRKNWGSGCPQLSHAISALTGAQRADVVVTREPCEEGCAALQPQRVETALCSHARPSQSGPAKSGSRLTFCAPIEVSAANDCLRLRIDLDFVSPEHVKIENGRSVVMALLPHFRRAMEVEETRKAPRQGGGQTFASVPGLLDMFSGQLAVIADRGTLLECNGSFSLLLDKETVVVLDSAGDLSFTSSADQQSFQSALASRKPSVFFTHADGADSMIVTVHPMPSAEAGGKNGTIGGQTRLHWLVWLRPKEPEPVSLEFLQSLFGLTRAETRVTEYVVQGLTLDEAAARIGVSRITARNQLTSAMSKLGVNRQAQLVTLILSMFPRLK